MTAQLSRERLEEIASIYGKTPSLHEAQMMAQAILAGMDSETLAVIDKEGNPMTRAECNDDRVFAICCKVGTPLYAAPPAPVAVPDEMYWQDAPVEGSTRAAAYATGWNACRAAMLKAGPVTAATVPDGWKLVPVDLTGDMTNAMTDAILDDLHNVDVWRSVLAAAPAAPEQEV